MGRTKDRFSWRAFISMGLFYSFLIILVTGIILYIAPVGRVARWIDWHLFGFTKKDWEAIHTVFSFLFVILSVFHLFFINWKTFWSYIKSKTKRGLSRKVEFLTSTLFSILLFLAIIFSIPPFNSIINFGNYLTDSWENENNLPPIVEAESLTLIDLSKKIEGANIETITQKLQISNIKFNNTNQTLLEIGEINNVPIREIYRIITTPSMTKEPLVLSTP